MKKTTLIIIAVVICSCKFVGQNIGNSEKQKKDAVGHLESHTVLNKDSIIRTIHQIKNLEFPFAKNTENIISHTGFSFIFNDAHKQSDWVVYMLCRERLPTAPDAEKRPSIDFKVDPAVKTGTATHKDYTNSGYDRGHLAPCRDLQWSYKTMIESFYMSNICPHLGTFHQAGGIWYKLEDLVRVWTEEYDTLYIVAGPALKQKIMDTIFGKDNKVSVPKYFYKVILNYTSNRIEGIGFIMPNEKVKSGNDIRSYATSIDSVQKFTGIDFFHKLPAVQQKYIESRFCDTCWIWEKPKK